MIIQLLEKLKVISNTLYFKMGDYVLFDNTNSCLAYNRIIFKFGKAVYCGGYFPLVHSTPQYLVDDATVEVILPKSLSLVLIYLSKHNELKALKLLEAYKKYAKDNGETIFNNLKKDGKILGYFNYLKKSKSKDLEYVGVAEIYSTIWRYKQAGLTLECKNILHSKYDFKTKDITKFNFYLKKIS